MPFWGWGCFECVGGGGAIYVKQSPHNPNSRGIHCDGVGKALPAAEQ